MQKKQKILIQLGLVVLVLGVAILAAKMLASFRKPPEKKPRIVVAPLLDGIEVFPETMNMTIQGYGTVEPRTDVQVVPQVSGKVIRCHPQLADGGFFKANEPLVVIEKADYKLAVQSALAAAALAKVQIEQEKAEAQVARQEWTKLHPNEEPQSVLVFRGPQIKSAQAQLKAAQAQLDKAKLDLKRTEVRMPFDGRVISANVDAGQFIMAGAPIATVYCTDLAEIAVPLEDSELAWFDVPQNAHNADSQTGSDVDIYVDFAGAEHSWKGVLVRTEGRVDSRSRMVHVVAQVQNPFQTEDDKPPLVPGMFARVDIKGREVQNIYRLPRYAIRGAKEVWIAKHIPQPPEDELSENKQLIIQPVQIIRMDRQFAYISEGLGDGDIVITSPLETVTDGMTIRVYLDEDQAQETGL